MPYAGIDYTHSFLCRPPDCAKEPDSRLLIILHKYKGMSYPNQIKNEFFWIFFARVRAKPGKKIVSCHLRFEGSSFRAERRGVEESLDSARDRSALIDPSTSLGVTTFRPIAAHQLDYGEALS